MVGVTFETYLPPEGEDLNDERLCALNRHAPEVIGGRAFAAEALAQRLLREDVDSSWPDTLQKWYEAKTGWLPPALLEWWDEQQKINPEVDRQPYEWWMSEADVVVGAWIGSRPVGASALVDVHWKDRPEYNSASNTGSWNSNPVFQEVRGWVVDEEFRGSGVGRLVFERILAVAHQRRLPIVAVTTNPRAAKFFERHGALDGTDTPRSPAYPISPELACWGDRRREAKRCEFCPRKPGQMWVWPAESKSDVAA